MKRFFALVGIALFFVSSVFAEESVLIDFAELVDDYQGQNKATLMDFSSVAGTRYTDEEKAAMQTSLYIPNWEVRLSSSSRTVLNDSKSYVRPVITGDEATKFAGEQIMGVRIHFPLGTFNSNAIVRPPFEIPAYATNVVDEEAKRGDQFNGYGVVKNVGVIKTVKANVLGRNFPMGFSVLLRDDKEEVQTIFMSYLDFDGWRELQWNNPNYITQVRNRELNTFPLYPRNTPAVTLEGILFTRDAQQEGGDFISYVKDIKIVYDLAVRDDIDKDVDDEATWGILADREESRRNAELKRLGNLQVLRYLEGKKMDTSASTSDSEEAEVTTP
ncbi:MAG: flagellar filament outer layer protein FlaA [Spirochaetaceae bacterium]|nr:flagellar filament outer layer protein FlaA [Spirochaetaceae bacterium]